MCIRDSVGAFQLGVLSVAQHIRHDGRIVPQLFQHVGIGGPAGLGLFPVGQAQLFKQDHAQLLGGVDVECLPRRGVDGLFRLIHDALPVSYTHLFLVAVEPETEKAVGYAGLLVM